MTPAGAGSEREIDEAFFVFERQKVDALIARSSPYFVTRAAQIATLAERHSLPTIYGRREFVDVGGLCSYASNAVDQYRQLGNYAARILKGEMPSDLPVLQPTKFDFIVNLQRAKTLGLSIARASRHCRRGD